MPSDTATEPPPSVEPTVAESDVEESVVEEGRGVAVAMNHEQDFDSVGDGAVDDDVVTKRNAPHIETEIGACLSPYEAVWR